MVKEYMLSIEELKTKFPLGSTQEIDGKTYVVKGYSEPMATNCMASFPQVIFSDKQ